MDEKTYIKIKEAIEKADLDIVPLCRLIAKEHAPLMWAMLEDWLKTTYPQWSKLYDGLVLSIKGGTSTGPSMPQARILRRMRDRGHTISNYHGAHRWTTGSDSYINRRSIMIMFERGWIKQVPARQNLEFELVLTEDGLAALSRSEMEYGDKL